MRASAGSAATLLVVALVGCGGGHPPRAPVARSVVRVQSGGTAVAPSLTTAPAPAGLFGVARLRDPYELLGVAPDAPALEEMRQALIVEEPIFELVDLKQPIEAALDVRFARKPTGADDDGLGSPDVFAGVSFGLTAFDTEAIRGAGFESTRSDVYTNGDCLIARALGGSPARLVCGDALADDPELVSYLLRGLPVQTLSTKPLYLEVRMEPFRGLARRSLAKTERATSELRDELGMAPALVEPVMTALSGLLREEGAFVSSAQKLRFEGQRLPDNTLRIDVSARFRGQLPWLVEEPMRRDRSVSSPPDAFGRLPADATRGGFWWGIPRRELEPMRAVWRRVVDATTRTLRQRGIVSERDVDFVRNLALSDCWFSEETVFAQGELPESKRSSRPASGSISIDRAVAEYLGWLVVGVDAGARCVETLRGGLDHPTLKKLLHSLATQNGKGLRLRRRHVPADLGTDPIAYRITIPKAFLRDVAGALDSDSDTITYTAGKSLELSLVGVRQGDVQWFAFGENERLLFDKLRTIRAGAPQSQLAARRDLQGLLRHDGLSGWFEAPEATFGCLERVVPGLHDLRARIPDDLLSAPFIATTHLTGGSHDATLEYSVIVPAPVLVALRSFTRWTEQDFEDLARALDLAPDAEARPTPIGSP